MFSDERNMIKYKELLAFVLMLGRNVFTNKQKIQKKFPNFSGFVAFFGNLVVMFFMARTSFNLHRIRPFRKKANLRAILILNLAISDLLVSVRGNCQVLSGDLKFSSFRSTFSLSAL